MYNFYLADLRVEWLKCRARAARWKEEVELLNEEMRRAIQFCSWKGKWWKEQSNRRASVSAHLTEGITAYALQHISAEQQRIISWLARWAAIRERAKVVLEGHLVGREDQVTITKLDIELEDDEDMDIPILDDEDDM